jgi:hypothetical protein
MKARLLAIALMLAGATAGCTRDELAAVDQIEAALTGKVVAEPTALPGIPEPVAEPGLVTEPEPEPLALPEPAPPDDPAPAPLMLANLPDDPPTPVCVPVFRIMECPTNGETP